MTRGGFRSPGRPIVNPAYPQSYPAEPEAIAKPNRLRQLAQPVLAIRDPQKLTFFHYFAFLYVILYVSRFIEFLPGFLRPILVFSIVLVGGALISGRILALFETTAGKWMAGFMLWLSISSIFSMWPGQSIKATIEMYKVLATAMVIVAFTSSMRAAYGMIVSAGIGLGMAGAFPFFAGGAILGDRLVVNATEGGSMADPNFFGLFLVTGTPLLVYSFYRLPKLAKLIPLGLLPLVLFSFIRTGSRSGMLALVGVVVFVFLRVPGRQKAKILILASATLAGLLALTPSNILLRYTSIVESDAALSRAQTQEELDELSRAGGSAEGRKHLMRQAIRLTFLNPLFGVGATMFSEAEEAYAMHVQGMERGTRHTTHNTFLQASAELGIPGFILFTGIVTIIFRNHSRVRQWCEKNRGVAEASPIRALALGVQAALVALYVEMMFLSFLYAGFAWLILALALASGEAARQELTRLSLTNASGQQTAPPDMLKRPGVVLAKDLAGVGNVPVQSPGEQLVGARPVRSAIGNRPIPGVSRRG
jgi:O-antigen ligase